ncbi:hypothetical protein M378DRAFT_159712, partial [Amanita muscaria Koide BX008]
MVWIRGCYVQITTVSQRTPGNQPRSASERLAGEYFEPAEWDRPISAYICTGFN